MESGRRLEYYDNARTLFASMIVIAHVVVSYSLTVWWYYKSGGVDVTWALSLYQLIGYTTVPGFFFMFGYFLRKNRNIGYGQFLAKRLKKYLTIFVLGFVLIVIPLSYIYHINNRDFGYENFFQYVINIFFGVGGQPSNWYDPYGAPFPDLKFTHLWFIQHCIIYTVIIGAFMYIKNEALRNAISKRVLTIRFLILFLILDISLVYYVRTIYPLDYWAGFLGFIQTEYANAFKYVFFVLLGVVFQRHNYIDKINKRAGLTLFFAGWCMFFGALIFRDFIPFAFVSGQVGISTFLWTVFDFIMGLTFILGTIAFLRDYARFHGQISGRLSAATLGVYIIHVPVVAIIQYLMDGWTISAIIKIIIQSLLGIGISFLIISVYHYSRSRGTLRLFLTRRA